MQTGLAPEAFAEKMIREYLPTPNPIEKMRQKLQKWQEEDNTPHPQPVPARSGLTLTVTLFEQWAEEDAKMTDAEREAEERAWEGFEEALVRNGRIKL